MPSEPILSICVPTYNRKQKLERNVSFHLDAFRRLGVSFEIVIVDDCSSDGTSEFLASLAQFPEVKPHRRIKNSGFVDNYAFAMRRAQGKYAVFLGDDDLLIPEKVVAYIEKMEADPRIGMVQAPWLCVDEREGKGPLGPFYNIPANARFMKGDFGALMQFILDFHVFPEFMIIRREVLARSISSPCPFIFWAFLYTARALTHADILFLPEPFARVTAISADPRRQQGHTETMFQWDRYRGGIEYLVSLAHEGSQRKLEERTALAESINRFMLVREKVALRLHVNAQNWVEAYILYHRIAAYEPAPLEAKTFARICQMAGLATAAAEAANYRTNPVVVDPSINDEVLGILKPELRERLVRPADALKNNETESNAYLRIDPAFPPTVLPGDAIFDVSDYMAQFI